MSHKEESHNYQNLRAAALPLTAIKDDDEGNEDDNHTVKSLCEDYRQDRLSGFTEFQDHGEEIIAPTSYILNSNGYESDDYEGSLNSRIVAMPSHRHRVPSSTYSEDTQLQRPLSARSLPRTPKSLTSKLRSSSERSPVESPNLHSKHKTPLKESLKAIFSHSPKIPPSSLGPFNIPLPPSLPCSSPNSSNSSFPDLILTNLEEATSFKDNEIDKIDVLGNLGYHAMSAPVESFKGDFTGPKSAPVEIAAVSTKRRLVKPSLVPKTQLTNESTTPNNPDSTVRSVTTGTIAFTPNVEKLEKGLDRKGSIDESSEGLTLNNKTGTNNSSRGGLLNFKMPSSLQRNKAISGRSSTELDLLKQTLSRSKSLSAKAYSLKKSDTDSPPLLFSQNRSSVSRSLSLKVISDVSSQNNDSSGGADYKSPTGKVYTGLNNLKVNDNSDHESQIIEDLQSKEEDEEASSDVISKKNATFFAATQETELNCLRSLTVKKNRLFGLGSAPFKLFYKAQNPELNKTADFFKDDDKPDDITGKISGPKFNNRDSIVMWILFLLLIATICVCVPFIVMYSRGTDDTVIRYLDNISMTHRKDLLMPYLDKLGLLKNDVYDELLAINNSLPSSEYQHSSSKISSSIAGISVFENIPLKYQQNEEIRAVMNNPNLTNVFYGIDYAPKNVIYPACGANMHDVMLDLALLSQVTSRIRTYGTQCNQTRLVLDSIHTLHLNMSLSIGVWIGPQDDINRQQLLDMKAILVKYPRKYFESIYIGNEVLFREEQDEDRLIEYIIDTKKFVQDELQWDLPVGTSELGSKASASLMSVVDIYGANIHPFFNGDSILGAVQWVFDFMRYQIDPILEKLGDASSPNIVISEIGWPYKGGRFQDAVAGKRQMQLFMSSWICDERTKNIPWYFFEAFDEPWKAVYHTEGSKWETEWGLFTADRKMKEGIVLPKC